MQRQRELLVREQERELRRQEMAVMKAMEARKKMEVRHILVTSLSHVVEI